MVFLKIKLEYFSKTKKRKGKNKKVYDRNNRFRPVGNVCQSKLDKGNF